MRSAAARPGQAAHPSRAQQEGQYLLRRPAARTTRANRKPSRRPIGLPRRRRSRRPQGPPGAGNESAQGHASLTPGTARGVPTGRGGCAPRDCGQAATTPETRVRAEGAPGLGAGPPRPPSRGQRGAGLALRGRPQTKRAALGDGPRARARPGPPGRRGPRPYPRLLRPSAAPGRSPRCPSAGLD